jgi:hypothetical protein
VEFKTLKFKNINERFGYPGVFDSLEEFISSLEEADLMPSDGLKEGRDYEVVTN